MNTNRTTLSPRQESLVGEHQFEHAVAKLREEFGVESFEGVDFLDLGCDGGVFSLAAYHLGADHVTSVATAVDRARMLREPEQDDRWTITQGNLLDESFIDSLGTFDAVYCWGAVHHTGAMWDAVDNAARTVASGGTLCLGIYNEKRGGLYDSRRAREMKRTYSALPPLAQDAMVYAWGGAVLAYRLLAHHQLPWDYIGEVDDQHGHAFWHDVREWVGRLPYEYATPEAVQSYFDAHHGEFSPRRVHRTSGTSSVNTYVFERA